MSDTELYAGPLGVYLPESLSLEQVQQGSRIVCDLTRPLPGTEDYSPRDTNTLDFRINARPAFTDTLDGIEQRLAADNAIRFDELDHTNPDNPLNPRYPRCLILQRRLMASAIHATYAAGFLDAADNLIRNPEHADSMAQDEWLPSTLHIADAAMSTLYFQAELRSRDTAADRNDTDELARYEALDRLTTMLSDVGPRHGQYESGGSISAASRERQGFKTSMTSTTGHLLEHIYTSLERLANRPANGASDSIPQELLDMVAVRVNVADKRIQQRDLFELACDLTLASITPYAHVNMSLKLGQLVDWLSSLQHGMQTVAAQTRPVALGRTAAQIAWTFPHVKPGETIPHEHILHARHLPDSEPSTHCPGSMQFSESDMPDRFHALFGPSVPKQFDRSPADQAVYLAVQAMRAYTLYRFDQDPEASIHGLIHIEDLRAKRS